jgi:hypothetical protein
MAAACASDIAWNEWAVAFDRSGQRAGVADESHGLRVHVSVLGLASLDGHWIEVYASVFNASDAALPVSKASEVGAAVERAIRRDFRRSGFRQSFRAPYPFAIKRVPTAAAAARESAGIFDCLVEGRR